MSEQSAPSSLKLSAGQMLRRAREQQQLSIEQIAARLNLRPSLVTDIEADNYDHIQIVAYRRGYLRAYARLLKLNDADVIAAHDREYGEEPKREMQRLDPIRPIKRPSRFGRLIFRLVTLAIIVGLGFMTLNWWRGHQDVEDKSAAGGAASESTPAAATPAQAPTASTSSVSAPTSATPAVAAESAVPNSSSGQLAPAAQPNALPQQESMQVPVSQGINGAQLTESNAAALTQSNSPSSAASAGPASPSAALPSTALPSATQGPAAAPLTLSCRQECWAQVRDAAGTTLQSGLLKAGEQRNYSGKAPYRIVIGNVTAATLSYAGQPVNLKKYARGGNVARFTLGK